MLFIKEGWSKQITVVVQIVFIWFLSTFHCQLSCTFSLPSGRLGRQLASQQTPTLQLGSWQAAIAVCGDCLPCGPHGTLAQYNPFAQGTWLQFLALSQGYKEFSWFCNSNNTVYNQALENIWTLMIQSQFAELSVLFVYFIRNMLGILGMYIKIPNCLIWMTQ